MKNIFYYKFCNFILNRNNKQDGFTIPELIISGFVSLIVLLAGISFLARVLSRHLPCDRDNFAPFPCLISLSPRPASSAARLSPPPAAPPSSSVQPSCPSPTRFAPAEWSATGTHRLLKRHRLGRAAAHRTRFCCGLPSV